MFDEFDDKSPSHMPKEDGDMRVRAGRFGGLLVLVALSLLLGVPLQHGVLRMLAWLGLGAAIAVGVAYWKSKDG